jgi:hypothetical protein
MPDILKNLSPILTAAASIVTIIGAGRQLWNGKKLDVIWVLLVGTALIIFIQSPNDFISAVKSAISFVSTTVRGMNGNG